MSTTAILLGFCVLFLVAIVVLAGILVHYSDALDLEKSSHEITMRYLEKERAKP